MRLSEAIRAGSRRGPQLFSAFIRKSDWLELGSCALGAAALGSGWSWQLPVGALEVTGESVLGWTREMWPALTMYKVPCPACKVAAEAGGGAHWLSYLDLSIKRIILHLNDEHQWSREAIADWVEVVESFFPIDPEPVAEPVKVPEEELVCV